MKKYFSFLITATLLLSCASKKPAEDKTGDVKTDSVSIGLNDLSANQSVYNLLCQDWDYKEDAASIDTNYGIAGLDIPYRGLSFFADATMVQNPRDDMKFGKWSFNNADKIITVNYEDGKTEKYKIMQIGAKNMTLKKGEDKTSIKLVADGLQEKNYADDPYYLSNNLWRIKSKQPETDDAIKERLRKCIRFYSLFFKDNIKRNKTSILFYGLPSCFTWYEGGISVKAEEKLDDRWINSFYNHEQAMKAHDIMVDLITKKYTWDKEEKSWVKQTVPVLQQMIDSLK